MTVQLHTKRLLLRPLQVSDAEQTQRLFPQWDIVKFLNSKVPWPYPADRVLNVYRNEILRGIERGEEWHWTLRLKEAPHQHIGVISLHRDEWDNRGYWLGLPWHRQGLMTEAVVAVNDYWFDVLGFTVLRAPKAVANVASRRISEKTGMRLMDGTLIEAWASHKSFRPKDGTGKPPGPGGDVDFRGEKRKNQTHESTTDPDARLFTKSRGSEAKLSYMGHVLMENRNGLLVQTFLTEATGRAERDAAMLMAEAIPPGKRVTLGGDKNYDTREFVRELRGMNITPHVAQNTSNRRSAVDERTTRHTGYELSQRKRKRVEQSFGWMKMIGMLKKVKLRGIDKVGWLFTFTGAAYNLCRLRNLMATT